MLSLILLVVAAILFGLAVFGVNSKYSLIAGGLFFWVLAELLPRLIALR